MLVTKTSPAGSDSSDTIRVPPRPVLPKRNRPPAKKEEEQERREEKEKDEDDADEGGHTGSAIMFGSMGRGASSMLESMSVEFKSSSNSSSSPALLSTQGGRRLDGDDDVVGNDDDGDDGGDDSEEDSVAMNPDLDLRPMKQYMRDLTLRLSEDQKEGDGSGGRKGGKLVQGAAKGSGTIRLYCVMKKGHQQLQQKKKEDENESDSDEEKGAKTADKESDDAWEAKRKQLGQAKKNEPVFVWKTLTLRSKQSAMVSKLAKPVNDNDTDARSRKKEAMLRQEFMDTEVTYVRNLETIIKIFLNPLKEMAADEQRAIIAAQHAELIFGRVVPLHLMHTELIKEFKKAESTGASLADAFFFFVPYLKVYTAYVNKHPSAIDLYFKLSRTNARFRRFLDECFKKAGMDAESFLILPIQRLPRYELLLTDLVKQTANRPNSEEHLKLKNLLAQIKEINQVVEDSRKREENIERMYTIYKSLVFPSKENHINLFDRPSRVYVREGQMQVLTNQQAKRFSRRYCFLFDDIMLLTKKRGDAYKFEYMFELRHIVPRVEGLDIVALGDLVFGLVDRQNRADSDDIEDDKQPSSAKSDTVEAHTLYLKASSPLDKSQWVEQLQELCSRYWTRVHFVRIRADTAPVLPVRKKLDQEDEQKSRSPAVTVSEASERIAVPPRPNVARKLGQKVGNIKRKSTEIAHNLLGSGGSAGGRQESFDKL